MKNDLNEYKEEFISLLKSTGRDGIDDVIEEIDRLGFFTAPASAGHHLNTEGASWSTRSTPARRRSPCGRR